MRNTLPLFPVLEALMLQGELPIATPKWKSQHKLKMGLEPTDAESKIG
jgi:hypothetical protein